MRTTRKFHANVKRGLSSDVCDVVLPRNGVLSPQDGSLIVRLFLLLQGTSGAADGVPQERTQTKAPARPGKDNTFFLF